MHLLDFEISNILTKKYPFKFPRKSFTALFRVHQCVKTTEVKGSGIYNNVSMYLNIFLFIVFFSCQVTIFLNSYTKLS